MGLFRTSGLAGEQTQFPDGAYCSTSQGRLQNEFLGRQLGHVAFGRTERFRIMTDLRAGKSGGGFSTACGWAWHGRTDSNWSAGLQPACPPSYFQAIPFPNHCFKAG
jgi:hypothetical protein